MRRIINIFISVIFLIIPIAYIGPGKLMDQFYNIRLNSFLGIICLNILLVPLATRRWQLILNMLSPLPRFVKCLQAQLVSMYAGLFLPNLISGTAVKIFMMGKLGVKAKHSFLSVLFDKIAVVLPLLVCVTISLPFLADHFITDTNFNNLYKIISAVFLALLGGSLALYLFIRFLKKDSSIFKELLRQHKAKFVKILILGICIIFIGVFQYWALFQFDIPFTELLLVAPTVIFLSSLPISIGGWGVREGSSVFFFSLIGIPSEAALLASVQIGLAGMLISMCGAFFWSKDFIPGAKKAMDSLLHRDQHEEKTV